MIIAILIAALALSIWRDRLRVRAWQIGCCIVAIASAAFGIALFAGTGGFHHQSSCDFSV
jgi:hypothetical protein